MTDQTVLREQSAGILTLTLNRPEKLNAVTDPMLEALIEAFDFAANNEAVRVVILTGAGRGFCPGQDLASARARAEKSGDAQYGEHLRHTYNLLVMKMRSLPKPIIAAVNGPAAGAGMSLALACDLRIAAENTTFLQAFVKVGLIPDSGSTWLLPRLIGYTRALELMLTGRKINAQEALQLGIVNQVVIGDELLSTAHQLAEHFATAPTKAIGYIKQAVDYAANSTFEEALEYEAVIQDAAGHTTDHREGLAAFLEKRPAQFIGK